jgi:hypothetical protein
MLFPYTVHVQALQFHCHTRAVPSNTYFSSLALSSLRVQSSNQFFYLSIMQIIHAAQHFVD